MPNPDAVRLRHMRDAAAAALEMAAGCGRSELDENMMLRMALTRCPEILEEAASKVTPGARAAIPAVPFGRIVAMRNRLIHAYFDVDLDIVWTTVAEDLPGLLPVLDSAVAAIENQG